MQILPIEVDYIQGSHNGPCVVIMGAVHGNERLGEAVIAKLRHQITPEKLYGDLILILGNPMAYGAHQRYMDCDLNRLFGDNFNGLKKKPQSELNVEEKRAIEIAPFLETADYLLDIHSTIKPSVPFVYCENTEKHLKIASLFGTQYVVSPSPGCRPAELTACADNYVDAHGGIGVTYEAGWHRGAAIFPEALVNTYAFLEHVGAMQPHLPQKARKKTTQLIVYDYIIAETNYFKFSKDYENFDVVEKGEVIGVNNEKHFVAKEKSLMVFPKIDIIAGKPLCYLAKELPN